MTSLPDLLSSTPIKGAEISQKTAALAQEAGTSDDGVDFASLVEWSAIIDAPAPTATALPAATGKELPPGGETLPDLPVSLPKIAQPLAALAPAISAPEDDAPTKFDAETLPAAKTFPLPLLNRAPVVSGEIGEVAESAGQAGGPKATNAKGMPTDFRITSIDGFRQAAWQVVRTVDASGKQTTTHAADAPTPGGAAPAQPAQLTSPTLPTLAVAGMAVSGPLYAALKDMRGSVMDAATTPPKGASAPSAPVTVAAPETSVAAPAQVQPAPSVTLQPAPIASATSQPITQPAQAAPTHDFEGLVDRLAAARETAMGGRAQLAMNHTEFGPVSMRMEALGTAAGAAAGIMKVALASADPDFAPAAQHALAQAAQITTIAQPERVSAAEALRDAASQHGGTSTNDSQGRAQDRDGEAGRGTRQPTENVSASPDKAIDRHAPDIAIRQDEQADRALYL
ncbi:hypothetical protein HME9302_00319 [Alteripontixanthobacter maritimus]|uniref:Uncharacterized protein n=1 Tax=Alteripontixanthobacter maritimus TaxID=2161824 RepID=A0A369Q2Z0_9SPHN|nr:hypothetical protein [Alteripontixanthobacter maritimus]RDC59134.1 hypothetical protein HME9302_00319 [Alteripontixanthobacter maritimus]